MQEHMNFCELTDQELEEVVGGKGKKKKSQSKKQIAPGEPTPGQPQPELPKFNLGISGLIPGGLGIPKLPFISDGDV